MRVTMRVTTPPKEVTANLVLAIIGKGEHIGLMFTNIYDDEIMAIGNQIIVDARARLGAVGESKEIREAVERIGWIKNGPPIQEAKRVVGSSDQSDEVVGAKVRTGVVSSDHPASVRLEFGTAPTANRAGYTAARFMSGAALAAAAAHRGAVFIPHHEDFVASNLVAPKKVKT